MREVHLWVGSSIVAGFGAMWLWGLGAWIVRRAPGRAFWWLLAVLQVALLLQLVGGLALLAVGGRQSLLHYAYGIVFPVLVLVVAHWQARETFSRRPWAPFAVAAFFVFGLTLRALTTGLGIG